VNKILKNNKSIESAPAARPRRMNDSIVKYAKQGLTPLILRNLKNRSETMPLRMTIDYPDTIPDALQETRIEFERNAKLAMFAKLFEMKKISSGMAASILGMKRVNFLLLLHQFNVPIVDLTEEELLEDINNA